MKRVFLTVQYFFSGTLANLARRIMFIVIYGIFTRQTPLFHFIGDLAKRHLIDSIQYFPLLFQTHLLHCRTFSGLAKAKIIMHLCKLIMRWLFWLMRHKKKGKCHQAKLSLLFPSNYVRRKDH